MSALGVTTFRSLGSWLAEADLIVLAPPLPLLNSTLESVARWVTREQIITDFGSTKAGIAASARELGIHQYVGLHPMAGSERVGFEHADESLFRGAACAITHHQGRAGERVTHWVRACLGSIPVPCSPEEHDEAVAAISHVPHALAMALVENVSQRQDPALAMALAGRYFRDITRVVATDSDLPQHLLESNSEQVREQLGAVISALEEVRAALPTQPHTRSCS